MSDDGNPFARSDRTIIRPNPGGRRPQPSAPAAPAPLPSDAPPSRAASAAPTSAPPGSQPGYAAPPSTPPQEEWISTPAKPPPPTDDGLQAPALRVDDLVAANANPIMRAAGPLLLLLGRLRVALLRASFASLMEQVAEAIKFFEKDIRSAGIPEEQANTAKYILCATADDIVQHIPTEDRHVWTQYSMLSRFFGERIGGVRFFEILEREKMNPLVSYPVLELQHACLALGFQGVHRTSPNGVAVLQQIQRDLYETLRRVKPKIDRDLSPRWRGQALASNIAKLRVPVWAVAAVAAVLLFALYVVLRSLLAFSSDAAAETTATLHPTDKVEIQRRVAAPPPPPPPPVSQVQEIRNELPGEIAGCKLTVDQTANLIVIRVCDIVFAPGQATVLDQFKPIAARIAAALDKQPGKIRIVGHTDSTPIHNIRFPSNWHLSVERARAVSALVKQGLSDPARVEIEGKGADMPIAPNATPEGRAKNRRVEVLISRRN
jgi:type VI secretion system protein ImpK